MSDYPKFHIHPVIRYLIFLKLLLLIEFEDYAEIVDNDEFDDYSQPISGKSSGRPFLKYRKEKDMNCHISDIK